MNWEQFVDVLAGPRKRVGDVMQKGPVRMERDFSESLPAALAGPLAYAPGLLGGVAGLVDEYAKGGLESVSDVVTTGLFGKAAPMARNVIVQTKKTKEGAKKIKDVEAAIKAGADPVRVLRANRMWLNTPTDEYFTHIPDDPRLVDTKRLKMLTGLNDVPYSSTLGQLYANKGLYKELPKGFDKMKVRVDPKLGQGEAYFRDGSQQFEYGKGNDGKWYVLSTRGPLEQGFASKKAAEKYVESNFSEYGDIVLGPGTEQEQLEALFHELHHGASWATGGYAGANPQGVAEELGKKIGLAASVKNRMANAKSVDYSELKNFYANEMSVDDYLSVKGIKSDDPRAGDIYEAWNQLDYLWDAERGTWDEATDYILGDKRTILKDQKMVENFLKRNPMSPQERKVFERLVERTAAGEAIPEKDLKGLSFNMYKKYLDEQLARGNAAAAMRPHVNPFSELTSDQIIDPREMPGLSMELP